MKKPVTVKIVLGLLFVKLFFLLTIIIAFYIVKDADSQSRTALSAIKDSLVKKYDLDISNPPYAFGTLIGWNLIPMIITILGIIFILKREFKATVITFSIDILVGLIQMNPIVAIINLVLILQKKSKMYFKG